jgi:hypothetical protein
MPFVSSQHHTCHDAAIGARAICWIAGVSKKLQRDDGSDRHGVNRTFHRGGRPRITICRHTVAVLLKSLAASITTIASRQHAAAFHRTRRPLRTERVGAVAACTGRKRLTHKSPFGKSSVGRLSEQRRHEEAQTVTPLSVSVSLFFSPPSLSVSAICLSPQTSVGSVQVS